MAQVVRVEVWDVRRRLREFDLTVDLLHGALKAGFLARASCTAYDPVTTLGTDAWSRTNRRLRELLVPGGWRQDDPSNIPLTINDRRKMSLTATTGDDRTGLVGPNPHTKSRRKGNAMAAALERNRQRGPDLFPETLPEALRLAALTFEYATWMLLFRMSDDEIWCELSLPVVLEDGEIVDWAERIILPQPGIGADDYSRSDDQGPDYDVDVRRRA